MRTSGPAVILLVLSLACEDVSSAPAASDAALSSHHQSASIIPIGGDEPPGEAPPESEAPPTLKAVEPDAGWRYESEAYAGAIVRYFATNALARATVHANSQTVPREKQVYHVFPLHGQLQVEATVPARQCEGFVRGDAYGKIWNTFLVSSNLVAWGEQADGQTKFFECPVPIKKTTESPVTSDGICYTVYVDYYWYYPDTGETRFRYTESYVWCDKNGPDEM